MTTSVNRLVNQVSHWTPARWSHAAPPGSTAPAAGGTRADALHDLIQRIADWAADLEGQPRRAVPRLDSDLALPDQLRVVATDLLAAEPPPEVRDAAVSAMEAIRRALRID